MKHYLVKEDFLIFKHKTIISDDDIPLEYAVYLDMYLAEGYIEESKPKKAKVDEPVDFDFNGDGKFDKKDVKLAAKAMGKARHKKRK